MQPDDDMVGETNRSDVVIGDRVTVDNYKSEGTVRWLGIPTYNKTVLHVGVELDKAVGKNNGTVKGHTYFKCKRKHGAMAPIYYVKKMHVGPLDASKDTAQKDTVANAEDLLPVSTPTSYKAAERVDMERSSGIWESACVVTVHNNDTYDLMLNDKTLSRHVSPVKMRPSPDQIQTPHIAESPGWSDLSLSIQDGLPPQETEQIGEIAEFVSPQKIDTSTNSEFNHSGIDGNAELCTCGYMTSFCCTM